MFVLVLETGDEVVAKLTAFATSRSLAGSHFTGIGAFRDVVLGYFAWEDKQYRRIALSEQVEVLSLVGDITGGRDGPALHAHVVVGRADGTAHGGHLIDAVVRPTLEVMLTESPRHLVRRHDETSGLALIKL